MKMLILLIVSFITFTATAGDRVGNGGDVIVCGDKVELLDLYEARVRGFKPLKLTTQNHEDMFREVLERRLSQLQPQRASRYREYGQEFFRESLILPGIELSDVADAGLAVIPRGCKLEQIAVQLADGDIIPGANRYTISQDLWDKLDEFNKMALMLHEVIYREAIKKNVGTSMTVRAMVGQLLRDEMDPLLFLRLTQTFSPRNRTELELFSYIFRSHGSLILSRLSVELYRVEPDSSKSLSICVTREYGDYCQSADRIDVSPSGYDSNYGRGFFIPAGEIFEFKNVRIKLSVPSHVEIGKSSFGIQATVVGEGTFEFSGAPTSISFSMNSFQDLGGQFSDEGASLGGRFGIVEGLLGPLELSNFRFSQLFIDAKGARILGNGIFIADERKLWIKGVRIEQQEVTLNEASLFGIEPLPMQIFERFTVPVLFNGRDDLTFNLGDFARTFKTTVLEVAADVVLRPAGGRNRPALILKKGLYEFSRGTDEVIFKVYGLPVSRRSFKIHRDGRIE